MPDTRTYGFSRNDAEELIQSLDSGDRVSSRRQLPQMVGGGSNLIIAQTPSAGIAARSGTSLSSANCNTYSFSGGTLSTDGGSFDVYNLSADAISGSTYIIAAEVAGIYIAIFEDCGGA